MGELAGELILRNLVALLADLLLWGTVGCGAGLVFVIGLGLLLAKIGAMGFTFPGAKAARVILWILLILVGLLGGGTLGAIHGAGKGLAGLVRDPELYGEAIAPAAGPLSAGLVHAVAIELGRDPAPMLEGREPIPAGPLRAVMTETTGAAIVAGLRRVPELQASGAGRTGTLVLGVLGQRLAGEHAEGAFETIGLRGPLAELAATLPAGAGATVTRSALERSVAARLLPGFVATWVERGVRHILMSALVSVAALLLAPLAIAWIIEGIVRFVRSRRARVAA